MRCSPSSSSTSRSAAVSASSPGSSRPPGSAHWPAWALSRDARRHSRKRCARGVVVTVDEHDRHRGVLARIERVLTPAVEMEVGDDLLAQLEPVRDHAVSRSPQSRQRRRRAIPRWPARSGRRRAERRRRRLPRSARSWSAISSAIPRSAPTWSGSRPSGGRCPRGNLTYTAHVASTAPARPISSKPGIDGRLDAGESVGGVAVVAPPHVPRVDVRQRDRLHPRADRADQQRRSARARRAWMEHAVGDVVVGAVEVDRAVAQQGADDRERFGEAVDAVVVRESEGGVLTLVPAGAETEDQPPVGGGVDRRRHLGEHRRRVEARRRHQRPELDPIRGRGASAASVVHTSHGPRGPTSSSYRRWSPSHSASKPTCSASRAIATRSPNEISYSTSGSWTPIFTGLPISRGRRS